MFSPSACPSIRYSGRVTEIVGISRVKIKWDDTKKEDAIGLKDEKGQKQCRRRPPAGANIVDEQVLARCARCALWAEHQVPSGVRHTGVVGKCYQALVHRIVHERHLGQGMDLHGIVVKDFHWEGDKSEAAHHCFRVVFDNYSSVDYREDEIISMLVAEENGRDVTCELNMIWRG